MIDIVTKVARALADDDWLDFDEVCGVDADPDEGYCDSTTCVAAHYHEPHDAEWARKRYRNLALAAIPVVAEHYAKVAEAYECECGCRDAGKAIAAYIRGDQP